MTDTQQTVRTAWPRPLVVAVVLAYRRAMIEGGLDPEASRAALAAYLAAGGDTAQAPSDIPSIVAAASRDHGDWFWRPVRERIAREEAWWRARGIWPPPKDRRAWPEEAGQGDANAAPG